jgi:hypothetical protein
MKIAWNKLARRRVGIGIPYGGKQVTIALWFGTVVIG